jgi:arylsulfatase A-like enzyme
VLFTSDNGPWISYGERAGVTPFREAKGTSFDGGIRSACLIKFPPQIKPGTTSSKTFCTLDILPTFAALAGASPRNLIDGKNVWDLIVDKPGAVNPNTYYPFSNGSEFQGIISGDGRWKLHLPHNYRTLGSAGKDGIPGKYSQAKVELSLFDMEGDPHEARSVLSEFPVVAARLQALARFHSKRFYENEAR